MTRFLAILLLLLIAAPAVAQTQEKEATPQQAMQKAMLEPDVDQYPVLGKLRGKEKGLSYDYLGKRHGIDAWLLSGPEIMQVVYTIPGQKIAIVGGVLVGPDAEDASAVLTRDFMKDHPQRAQEIMASVRSAEVTRQVDDAARAKMSPSERLWADLAGTGRITYAGKAGTPEIYALLDPAKPETREVWSTLSPLAKDKAVTLHIVPLAVTERDSILAIANALGDADPAKFWENLVEGRPVKPAETVSARGMLKMKATIELAQRLKLRQLPMLVYRVPGNEGTQGPVRILRGSPKDWDKFLKELGVLSDKTP